MFPAFTRFYHGPVTETADKEEPHVCHSSRPVQSPFFFHLFNNMADHFLFVVFQVKCLFHQMVPFYQLARCKADGDVCRRRMVFYEVHNAMKSTVHRPVMVLGTAEILDARFFLVSGHMNRMAHQLLDPPGFWWPK